MASSDSTTRTATVKPRRFRSRRPSPPTLPHGGEAPQMACHNLDIQTRHGESPQPRLRQPPGELPDCGTGEFFPKQPDGPAPAPGKRVFHQDFFRQAQLLANPANLVLKEVPSSGSINPTKKASFPGNPPHVMMRFDSRGRAPSRKLTRSRLD